jgi:hypothetical protein
VPWAQVIVPNTIETQIFPFCEDVLARLRLGGCQNQGTINFLELLQHLRPFFWRVRHKKCSYVSFINIYLFCQAIGSIQEHFPDSGIIKRLDILSQPDAELFLKQWPTLRGQEEAKSSQLSVLRSTFHESPTREAFSSFAAQMHGMNQFMESTAEKLSVLTRRTEIFSPSKCGSQPMFNLNSSSNLSRHPPSPCNLIPSVALPTTSSILRSSSPSPAYLNSLQSASLNSGSPTSGLLPLDPQPLVQLESTQSVASNLNGRQVYPTTSGLGFPRPAIQVLSPATVSASNRKLYLVLPLSPATPDQPLIHTSHDLVLPPVSAFLSSTYPVFTTVDCTWQYILDEVVNPSSLWASYSPGSLGEYSDVKSIWQVWDEGEYIKDVGHKPALRLIDARWGNLESQETRKRKYPSWRPRNDNKVCACSIFIYGNLTSCRPARYGQIFILYSPHRWENQVRE